MRSLGETLKKDLGKKLVLLSGPRQVGKTTLARPLNPGCTYYNYDFLEDRKAILKHQWNLNPPFILDELHKHTRWKLWLKGLYDTEHLPKSTLVTGSARMNTFRKEGYSLAGRFFHHILLPIDLKEGLRLLPSLGAKEILERILNVSGFPEPFFNGDLSDYRRWRSSHLDVILKQDLLELENVRTLGDIQNLFLLLIDKVGGLLSYQSLCEDLSKSDKTIRNWVEILENSYLFFRVYPLGVTATSIKKMPKLYLFDLPRVEDEAARFENCVALALYKEVLHLNEAFGHDLQLRFLRNKQKQEIDFAILDGKKVTHMIEVKLSDPMPSQNFKHYEKLFPKAKKIQVVLRLDRTIAHPNGVTTIPAREFLAQLNLTGETPSERSGSK
jgi:predicted AAA+ superfamily ATPase